mgnify:CR=1 FL=1
MRGFSIAGRAIGPDHKPFVICELSGNHNGSLERALLIDRRSYGLYDLAQQKVLRQLAESLVKVGHLLYLTGVANELEIVDVRDPARPTQVAVVGAQSAGKSSVLESLVRPEHLVPRLLTGDEVAERGREAVGVAALWCSVHAAPSQ